MNITKKQWSNIIFFSVLALIIFTPVGTFVKVQLGKLYVLVSNPTTIEEENRETISDFNWNLVDGQGESVNFKEMEGEVILVNFWATWCPPCIAEMPNLNALHTDYKDKIRFVFVANDNEKRVNAYLKKNEYDLPVYYTKGNEPKELSSPSIPTTYLIDDQGNIVMKELGSADWNSSNVRNQIDELLAFSLAE
ncbi:TlpA family protein disulfide reductase [Kordia sp.]|uniref:TlpA family protein disulfide reductase n=1 Tax=Kordia sp. TaxID=1965332 RepID=UPI003D2C4C95